MTADQMRQWIADGRVNAQTNIQEAGTTEWRPLGEFPQFAAALPATPSPAPAAPPFPSRPAPTGPTKLSRAAVWSVVLGILGIPTAGLAAIAGLVLGIVAMVKINKSNGALRGSGLALSGTIISGVCVLILPILAILAAMLLPALAQAKSRAQTINCVNNMKQLALGVRIYATDNKDQFPPAETWCDAINSTVGSPRVFICPAAPPGQRSSYAFNAKLGGKKDGEVNPSTVMIFETAEGWNRSGGPESMLKTPRHNRTFVVAFVDGSVQQVTAARLAQLRWDP